MELSPDLPDEIRQRVYHLRDGHQATALKFWREQLGMGLSLSSLKRLDGFISFLESAQKGKREQRQKSLTNRRPIVHDWRIDQ